MYVFLNKIGLAQRFSALASPALPSLHPLLHHCQIHSFYMLDVVWLVARAHRAGYLFVIGRDVEELFQSLQEL